jgi:RimJ/RimL family protein N-acetyltransferase
MEPLSFRPLTPGDLPVLHEWLSRPHVVQWWGDPGPLSEVESDYLPTTQPGSKTRGYIALQGEEPIGFIQSYVVIGSGDGWWEGEADPGARGIDQFLANADQLGRGLGSAMVRAFVELLFSDPAVTKVQTDPSPDNQRAIRSYRRAGFVATGEVVTPDGPAFLMMASRPSDAAPDLPR